MTFLSAFHDLKAHWINSLPRIDWKKDAFGLILHL